MKVNNKIKITSLIFLMFFIFPIALKAEETLGDIKKELEKTESEYNKKSEELEKENVQYDQLYTELTQVSKDITTTENSIVTTENQIKSTEKQITDIEENKIPKLEEKAAMSLKFSQKNNNENIVLSLIYNSLNNDTSILEVMQSSNKVFFALNDSLFEMLSLLEKVEQDKENLAEQKVGLETQKKELTSQEKYITKLKDQISQSINDIESDLKDQEDVIKAQKEQERLYKEAGCGPNDVYGVDCATNELPASNGSFSRPLAHGVVTNEFGGWSAFASPHKGIDIANSQGTPIYGVTSGKVLYAGYSGDGGGVNVILLHLVDGKNYISRYCHMTSTNVAIGDVVSDGQQIGALGSTGAATGPHLHLEIQQGSNYVWDSLENPRDYVNFPALGVWW